MSIPLLALGPHLFELLPLTLQRIEEETTANWPAIERFGAGPARQFTGPGDATMKLEGLFFNEEFGGYGEYLALKETQKLGLPVDLVGWGAGSTFAFVMGAVVILKVSATHEHIGMDGIGKKTGFTVEVAKFGGDGSFGGLF